MHRALLLSASNPSAMSTTYVVQRTPRYSVSTSSAARSNLCASRSSSPATTYVYIPLSTSFNSLISAALARTTPPGQCGSMLVSAGRLRQPTPRCRAASSSVFSCRRGCRAGPRASAAAPRAEAAAEPVQEQAQQQQEQQQQQQELEDDKDWFGPGVPQLRYEYELMNDEEVDDLINYTAGLISVLDDVRPLDPATYNASYEIWHAIAAIPPSDRPRLIDELEPGALRSLWRYSLSRYVLDPERCAEIFSGYSVWDDFPEEPGQVIWYDGLCERTYVEQRTQFVDLSDGGRRGGPQMLKPKPGFLTTPQDKFQQAFWCSAETGAIYSHVRWHVWGPLHSSWIPLYNRLQLGPVLTPLQRDAGADGLLVYSSGDQEGIGLTQSQLPLPWWPRPPAGSAGVSPFSGTGRDFLRAVGPGVYVGCGYTAGPQGEMLEDDFVYFLLVRRV